MSGFGAVATGALLAAATIALGVVAGRRRPPGSPKRRRPPPPLVWSPALLVGVAIVLLVELVSVPGGLALLVVAYGLLLAVCLKNLLWTGTPIVALGLVLIALPTIVDGGMPVSRDALARMGYHDPPSSLPGERHLEVPGDQLRALGDIVPLPIGWRPVSFGELILLVGLADVAYNAAARRRGAPAGSVEDAGIDTLASLVIDVDPLEDEPTVFVLGTPPPGAAGGGGRRPVATGAPAPRKPVLFDVEAEAGRNGPQEWTAEEIVALGSGRDGRPRTRADATGRRAETGRSAASRRHDPTGEQRLGRSPTPAP